jgi:hypothetical protein
MPSAVTRHAAGSSSIVLRGQREGQVAGRGDQCGVHLVRRQRRARHLGVAQPVVRAGLPAGDHPLVQQVLQVTDRPHGHLVDVDTAAGDVAAGVAGDVLAEQRVDRGERPLHRRLVRRCARVRGLHRDPQPGAGGQERRRQKHAPRSQTIVSGVITGLAAASVSRSSAQARSRCGSREARIRSASGQPGRIGSGTNARASSSAASTAFVPCGRSTAAHRVRVATSNSVVSSTRGRDPDIEHRQHVQRGGVDLHQLTRPHREHGAERAVRAVGQRAAGGRRPERVPAGVQACEQPVERRGRRHRDTASAVGVVEQLLHPAPHPPTRAGRGVGLLGQRLPGRGHDTLVDPAGRRGRFDRPLIDQTPQARRLVRGPAAPDRADADPVPERRQFTGFGLLPFRESGLARVVPRPRLSVGTGVRREPGLNLDQVPLPPAGPLHDVGRCRLEQAERRQRRPT